MLKKPSITVVIATFNAASTISSAVQSVLSQDYPSLELLIIDGASTDQTVDLVSDFNDSRIRVFSEPDGGIYDAWNKGVRLSSSDRILFIGADDVLDGSSAISGFWSRIQDDLSDCPIVYGDLIALSVDGSQIGRVGANWRDPWSFQGRHIWSSFPVPIMATFFDRKTIFEEGLFDASLRIMADINLVLKISRRIDPVYVPGSVITLMGFGGISTRPDAGALAMQEAVKIRRIHGLGTYTNLEFLARVCQHQIKYWVSKYLGPKVTKNMVGLLHGIKKAIFSKRMRAVDK